MKKLFLIATILFGLVACRKEKTEVPVPSEKKLVEYRNINTGEARTYTYDSKGQLTKAQSGTHVWTFQYASSKLVVTANDATTGKLLSTTEHTLDASGKTITAVMKDGNGDLAYTLNYEYDANGFMIKEKYVYAAGGGTQENFYTIAGGNVVKQVFKTNGVLQDETDYEYDLSIPCKIYSSMASNWQIKNLYGKGFTNEMKGFKRYDATGALVFEKVSTHVLDPQGYVIKLTNFYPITNLTYEYAYTYQ